MMYRRMNIKQQEIILFLLFVLSFFHSVMIITLFTYMIFLSSHSVEYCVKSLMLIAFRTIISTQIAIDISSVQMFKWAVIFLLSTLIFLEAYSSRKPQRVNAGVAIIALFSIYICVISLIYSSYPVVSLFKCFSYAYVFISILVGVSVTASYIEWSKTLYSYFSIFILACIISMPFPFAYYSQAHWFCGVANQSQMFGIMAALYCALVLYRMVNGRQSIFNYILLFAVTYETFLSGSRTGMIASLICILYGLFVEVFKNKKVYLLLIAFVIAFIVAVFYQNEFLTLYRNFILKDALGTSNAEISIDSIMLSRQGQYELFLQKYHANPIWGTGFMVPFMEGNQDWSFSFGLIVENGNIFYSVLGDLGIVGLLLFVFTYTYIYLHGGKRRGSSILFFAPFLVCFGEMVFFSTNNNAILLYAMIAVFFVEEEYESNESFVSDQYSVTVSS